MTSTRDVAESLGLRVLKVFRSSVAGESFHQSAIENCCDGEAIELVRQRDNPYDKNAVAVTRENGELLGYIPREFAGLFADELDAGVVLAAKIKKVVGGTDDKPTLGLILEVTKYSPP